jgi:glycosyltransferase involved in cell wall biosynthesis
MSDDNFLMVSVDIITYGHEKHIRQAIEGVLMQETSFQFDLIIADDCSPDNTREIVEEIINNHPKGNKIKYFRHAKNLGIQANSMFALEQCTGKYIAICEGDDYWTSPLKLQNQVDFLEANPDYALVHTGFDLYYDKNDCFVRKPSLKNDSDFYFEQLVLGRSIVGTLTVCLLKKYIDAYNNEIQPHKHNWLMGDLPLWLYISNVSKIHYINESMATYRILEESASQSSSIIKRYCFEDNISVINMFFVNKYFPNNISLQKRIIGITLYKKMIVNRSYNGSWHDFFNFFIMFHRKNRDFYTFCKSFKQLGHKLIIEFFG